MNPSPPPTSTEVALGKYVQGAWVAFARDPVNGLHNYGWPTFDPTTASLVQLGNVFNQSGATFDQSVLLDLPCNVTASLDNIKAQVLSLLNITLTIVIVL